MKFTINGTTVSYRLNVNQTDLSEGRSHYIFHDPSDGTYTARYGSFSGSSISADIGGGGSIVVRSELLGTDNNCFVGDFLFVVMSDVDAYRGYKVIYSNGSELVDESFARSGTITIDAKPFSGGANSLVFNDMGDTEFVEYNGKYYNTFPVTISLVAGVTNFYIKGKEYSVTMNNAGNLKSVQIGSTTYTTFPRTITIDGDKTMLISGADSPTITVDYKNTKTPVVTDT